MPNGSGLTSVQIDELQRMFSPADDECEQFARRTHAQYSREYHGHPHRRFLYAGHDEVTRCILISCGYYTRGTDDASGRPTFVKRDLPVFIFDAMAWKDDDSRRKSWHREIERSATLPKPQDLRAMLQEMLELINAIREEDLT